jgi:uncharacterized membrane protein required for colicin V production
MVMNIGIIVVGLCAVGFVALPLIFRSSAVAMFLALCAGAVMSKFVAQDATLILNSIANINVPMFSIVQIFLLIVGPLVLLFGLKGSVKTGAILWQVLPALAAAILAVYFIAPMLPFDSQKALQESQAYRLIEPYFGLAAAAGLLASVFWLLGTKPKHDKEKHGKKHKK